MLEMATLLGSKAILIFRGKVNLNGTRPLISVPFDKGRVLFAVKDGGTLYKAQEKALSCFKPKTKALSCIKPKTKGTILY